MGRCRSGASANLDNLPTATGGHNPYMDYERAKGLIELTGRMDQDNATSSAWSARERNLVFPHATTLTRNWSTRTRPSVRVHFPEGRRKLRPPSGDWSCVEAAPTLRLQLPSGTMGRSRVGIRRSDLNAISRPTR